MFRLVVLNLPSPLLFFFFLSFAADIDKSTLCHLIRESLPAIRNCGVRLLNLIGFPFQNAALENKKNWIFFFFLW